MQKLTEQDEKINLVYKNPIDIIQIAYSAEILFKLFQTLPALLTKRVQEKEIEKYVVAYLHSSDCIPAMHGYRGFSSEISISRNHVLAHGVPSDDFIEQNDLVTIDVVCKYMDWYADASWTYGIGVLDKDTQYLLNAAWKISRVGINQAREGRTLRDIAEAIEQEAKRLKVYVYNQFVGHGIGRELHEMPYVIYDKRTVDMPLRRGMVLCIEPIVSLYPQAIKTNSLGEFLGEKKYKSAVFEHMVGIFPSYTKVLTYRNINSDQLPIDYPFDT